METEEKPEIVFLDKLNKSGKIKAQHQEFDFHFTDVAPLDINLLELGVKVEYEVDGKKIKNIKVTRAIPYQFAEIKQVNGIPKTITDTPVFHNGKNPGQKDLLSGEIHYTMEVLTPLLAANDQYSAENVKGAQKIEGKIKLPDSWGIANLVDPEKSILEPLRLSGDKGLVLISGAPLKGMLRHSLGALFSTPMERVAEHTYSYRPNSAFGNRNLGIRIDTRPAIVTGVTEDGGIQVQVLSSASSAEFDKRDIPEDNEETFDYAGGIDGTGKLACAFKNGMRVHKKACVLQDELDEVTEMVIPRKVVEHYYKTQKHLSDQKEGHLRNEHPLHKEGFFEEVASDIKKCQDVVKNPGQLIYVEIEWDEKGQPNIISMGHHFRYRWRYKDTVCTTNQGERRSIISPLPEEKATTNEKHEAPCKLSFIRALFGYVSDDQDDQKPGEKNPGTEGIGRGDFKKLAGRIAFNMAIEVDEPSQTPRFLNEAKECVVPLKPLGQPRASAVEYYLDQSRISELNGRGLLVTYGDLPEDSVTGELRGRKFYAHQPQVNENEKVYTADTQEIRCGKQAALARFVSTHGTKFRFTLRFRDLRTWELGAVMLAMEPQLVSNCTNPQWAKIKDYLNQLNPGEHMFAHKLGHGRPLGLGSVVFKADAVLQLNDKGKLENMDQSRQDAAVRELGQRLDEETLLTWLKIHQFKDRPEADYPRKKDKKGETTIYNFHTDLHNEHCKRRRGNGNGSQKKEKKHAK